VDKLLWIGLAAGFIVYFLDDASHPMLWQRFKNKWLDTFPELAGRPFNCDLCMSYWVSTFLLLIYHLVFPLPLALTASIVFDSVISIFSVAAVSLLFVRLANRLNITVIR